MTIANLFARIGIKADKGPAKRLGDTVNRTRIAMAAAATAAVALTVKIRNLTKEAKEAARAMKQLEAETGFTQRRMQQSPGQESGFESLQRWQAVARATNNAAQAVTASVRQISQSQAQIRLGSGDVSGWQLIGIDPRNADPFEILEQLRGQMTSMNQQMKAEVLDRLGISRDLIQVLDLSREQFDQLAQQAFVIPPSAIDSLDAARASGEKVGMAFQWLKNMVAAELAPEIQKLNEAIVEWVRNNREGIVRTIRAVIEKVSGFVNMLSRAWKMIDGAVTATIGWESAIRGIIAVISVLNAHLLLTPLGAFVAAVVLLLAVLEDIYVYRRGGESLIGYFMENIEGFDDIVNAVTGAFQEFTDAFRALTQGNWAEFNEIVSQWGILGTFIMAAVDGMRALGPLLEGMRTRNWGNLRELAADLGVLGGPLLKIADAIETIQNFVNQSRDIQNEQSRALIEQMNDPFGFVQYRDYQTEGELMTTGTVWEQAAARFRATVEDIQQQGFFPGLFGEGRRQRVEARREATGQSDPAPDEPQVPSGFTDFYWNLGEGSVIPGNDVLITKGGQIVRFNPNDSILAMKKLGDAVKPSVDSKPDTAFSLSVDSKPRIALQSIAMIGSDAITPMVHAIQKLGKPDATNRLAAVLERVVLGPSAIPASNVTNQYDVDVHVYGNNDPMATANAVNRELERTLKGVSAQRLRDE